MSLHTGFRIAIFAKTSLVGSTQSIGIEWQRSVEQIDPQRPISTRASGELDLPACDNFTANEAVTLVIQGMPISKLIKSSQSFQLLFTR
jgi:hypothetical protein